MAQHSLTLDPGEEKKTTFTVDAATEEGTYTLCSSAHPGSCLETGSAEKRISAAEKVCRDIKVSKKAEKPPGEQPRRTTRFKRFLDDANRGRHSSHLGSYISLTSD